MIIAVVAIAILTAVAVDFRYNAHVDLRTAANQRDEAQAYFLAKSSVGLSRLVLSFQKQLDSIKLPSGIVPTGSGIPTSLNIQLYKLARVDCHMLRSMISSGAEGEVERQEERPSGSGSEVEGLRAPPARSFGGFTGCFDSQIEPEESKINLNALNMANTAAAQSALRILSDKRFEFLFEREDRHHVKVTPQELLIHIQDWVDQDEVQSALNLTGAGPPFVRGFTDENSVYTKYEPRYEAKNAYFDSLDELYMVYGVNDRIMAAFRNRFTVYTNINSPANINSDDPILLLYAILNTVDFAKPAAAKRMNDPLTWVQAIQAIRAARAYSVFGLDTDGFAAALKTVGLPVRSDFAKSVSDKNNTFTIHAIGTAGAITRKLTAVVRMDGGGLGRLVYWREE
ncbi:MAG TPA: type II secretion system minor pseudopilin GspK [Myxococcaceae bacterium]|nr:type II secretion system minor pseudopilin GspK [Myxococcaceae bacterium]